MVEVNQLSLAFFRRHFQSAWRQPYLADRFSEDIADDPRFQPGPAPGGWTNLVDYLRQLGVTDQEMTTTGVAVVTSTGRLIDRFRDQVVFPITYRAQLMESLDNQGRDVAAITRNLVPQHR